MLKVLKKVCKRKKIMLDFLILPFSEFDFMQRALVGVFVISLGATPIGIFLLLRGMSLSGDAISHTMLPGVAIAYSIYGVSLVAMSIGGFIIGLSVVVGAGLVSRKTHLKEDATLAAFYLISLAVGVIIVTIKGSTLELMHILFGQVLALDDASLILLGVIASATLVSLAFFYRAFVFECFDKDFFSAVSNSGNFIYYFFLTLVVLNFVAGFQALGTLMVVAIMILPAASSRFWTLNLGSSFVLSFILAFSSGFVGLLVSYYYAIATGPAIVLILGFLYFISFLFGKHRSFLTSAKRKSIKS